MDKKEEKIDQEESLGQQVKSNHTSNVWLVTFFVLFSLLTISSFLSKFSSDRINNFFLPNNTKSENEIIDEKFSDYWERLKKIVELIFIALIVFKLMYLIKNSFQSKILKSVSDKDVKKVRDGFLNFQKNIIYDYYTQSGFLDSLKRSTIKKINDYALLIGKKNKKIEELKNKNALSKKEENSKKEVISKEKEEISALEKTIIKLSHLLNKIFSKKNIFEIIGFFLNSQSIMVNPFCDYNVYIRDNVGESLEAKKNYIKKYFFSKTGNNGEKVLPVFENNFDYIFFNYYTSEDDNEVLEDIEEVIKRAREIVTHYEKLETNGPEVKKISEFANKKLVSNKYNYYYSDDEPDEKDEKEYYDFHLLKNKKKYKHFQECKEGRFVLLKLPKYSESEQIQKQTEIKLESVEETYYKDLYTKYKNAVKAKRTINLMRKKFGFDKKEGEVEEEEENNKEEENNEEVEEEAEDNEEGEEVKSNEEYKENNNDQDDGNSPV